MRHHAVPLPTGTGIGTYILVEECTDCVLIVRLCVAELCCVEVPPLCHALLTLLLPDLYLRLFPAAAELVCLELALVLVGILAAASRGHGVAMGVGVSVGE